MEAITIDDRDAIVKFFLGETLVSNPKQSSAFLDLYEDLVIPKTIHGCSIRIDEELLQDHKHLLDVSETLRKDPRLSRNEFILLNFPHYVGKMSA